VAGLVVVLLCSCTSTTPTATTEQGIPTPTAGGGTPKPTPAPFVCANPPGSSAVYAYTAADGQVYWVQGCSTPRQLTHEAPNADGTPQVARALAWSPSNRYLAVSEPTSQDFAGTVVVYDVATGQPHTTAFLDTIDPNAVVGATVRFFIGWQGDNTFIGAINHIVPTSQAAPEGLGPYSIVRVDRQGGQETTVGSITWMADAKVRANGHFVFYGGYQSSSEGQGFIHRFNLATGADVTLVPLGYAGPGGCQGTPYCPYTAPWDVTPDGQHVVYHIPGPSSAPSDVNSVPDTPLYFANLDGSQAVRLFADVHAAYLQAPMLSPDGTRVFLCCVGSATGPAQSVVETVTGAGEKNLAGSAVAWRGDSQTLVTDAGADGPYLVNVAVGSALPLTAGTASYVWGT
jgi:hypothetical protein